ncbi:MAG: gliding motility lipoprotein GldB [Eudoraea sp.]|nr:gliding motility lipoprotein GldB [Eudoraea sp.]
MLRSGTLILLLLVLMCSCKNDQKIQSEIAAIPLDLTIIRFDQEFASTSPEQLPALKAKYPYFFPAQYPDSVWVAKIQDSLQLELRNAVDSVFTGFDEEEQDIELLFKHIAYYFPAYEVPTVITLTSDVDYQNRIILTDTLLLIGLDNYLGKEHRFYGGIERYIAKGLDKTYLESDIVSAFSKQVVPYVTDRTFLSQLIYYGKELYLKDLLLPWQSDAQKIGYTQDEIEWAEANEEQIWRYFIEREILYSTDNMLGPRFLDPAPFSKFRLELDNESPGRLGRYMGWQIVRAFMEKNDVSPQDMFTVPAEMIFQKSNYKPKK